MITSPAQEASYAAGLVVVINFERLVLRLSKTNSAYTVLLPQYLVVLL